jgi:hypothetical protein
MQQNIPWKRITTNGGQHTVVVTQKVLTEILINEVHGNMEGQYKTKALLVQSHWLPGMDGQINKHLQECDKCQRTKRTTTIKKVWLSSTPSA